MLEDSDSDVNLEKEGFSLRWIFQNVEGSRHTMGCWLRKEGQNLRK
jgi:hypothetical protein